MAPSILHAEVEFELFSASISGKSIGYRSGVRPNHYIDELGCTVIGSVEFDGGSIELGERKRALISYLYWEPFAALLKPGLEYEVREGSRRVGNVRVLKTE